LYYYVHYIDLLMWSSKKIGFSILWFFYDLLLFFKDSPKIIKKIKGQNHRHYSKTTIHSSKIRLRNCSREVKCMIWKIEGGGLPDFEVERERTDFYESWGSKNNYRKCFTIVQSYNSYTTIKISP
jgi:hypothetical protein